jgi:hypothetical protein
MLQSGTRARTTRRRLLNTLIPAAFVAGTATAQDDFRVRFRRMSDDWERKGLAEPFKGITTNGEIEKGLFPVQSTGVSTAPVRVAAERFLGALNEDQRKRTMFPVDDPEWRKWMNQHFYIRQGVSFEEMSSGQRDAAFGLLQASLSGRGFELARNIMKLNETLAEIANDSQTLGEWKYHITVMGKPSEAEPWGWQIDGHHLIINFFILGSQVVMTPVFIGSEPVIAEGGKYKGTAILQREQNQGLELFQSLGESQRKSALLQVSKTGNNNLTEAFKDNVVLDYAGARVADFDGKQTARLVDLMDLYIGNMAAGHAKVRMDEVKKHLKRTTFAWIGGAEPESVFYYRIHSPVILIEFDHQQPVALRGLDRRTPTRQHIHCVIRTPNGNDYGKDLLRQHYARHAHTA